MTPAPPVIDDDKKAAAAVIQLIKLDEGAGREALEKICSAARTWAISVGNKKD